MQLKCTIIHTNDFYKEKVGLAHQTTGNKYIYCERMARNFTDFLHVHWIYILIIQNRHIYQRILTNSLCHSAYPKLFKWMELIGQFSGNDWTIYYGQEEANSK